MLKKVNLESTATKAADLEVSEIESTTSASSEAANDLALDDISCNIKEDAKICILAGDNSEITVDAAINIECRSDDDNRSNALEVHINDDDNNISAPRDLSFIGISITFIDNFINISFNFFYFMTNFLKLLILRIWKSNHCPAIL